MTRRMLVTGASGRIGHAFVRRCERGPDELVRADLEDTAPGSPFPFLRLDVTDDGSCREACRGVDVVVHLAADPSPTASFDEAVLPINIVGTRRLARAAVEADVGRFVFASSVQAVAGYPDDHQVREDDAPRPLNDYGVGKAFGEALCASLAASSSTSFVAVRIGHYAEERPPPNAPADERSSWLSPADAHRVLLAAATAPVRGFVVAHGISDNAWKRLSVTATRAAIGFDPRDDAFAGAEDG